MICSRASLSARGAERARRIRSRSCLLCAGARLPVDEEHVAEECGGYGGDGAEGDGAAGVAQVTAEVGALHHTHLVRGRVRGRGRGRVRVRVRPCIMPTTAGKTKEKTCGRSHSTPAQGWGRGWGWG